MADGAVGLGSGLWCAGVQPKPRVRCARLLSLALVWGRVALSFQNFGWAWFQNAPTRAELALVCQGGWGMLG